MQAMFVDPEITHGLREEVLHWKRLASPKDSLEGSSHLAVFSDPGKLLGVGSVGPVTCPLFLELDANQFWGIAVNPNSRYKAIGRTIMNEIIQLSLEKNKDIIWAKARESAIGFYSKLGFIITNETCEDINTGLPTTLVYEMFM